MKEFKFALKRSLPTLFTVLFLFCVTSIFGQDIDIFGDATEVVKDGIGFMKVVFILILFIGLGFIAWAFFTNNPRKMEIVIGFVVVLIIWGLITKYGSNVGA